MFYVTAGPARWADCGNRRNIVALVIGVWEFMTAISGLVQNYVQLLLARMGRAWPVESTSTLISAVSRRTGPAPWRFILWA